MNDNWLELFQNLIYITVNNLLFLTNIIWFSKYEKIGSYRDASNNWRKLLYFDCYLKLEIFKCWNN